MPQHEIFRFSLCCLLGCCVAEPTEGPKVCGFLRRGAPIQIQIGRDDDDDKAANNKQQRTCTLRPSLAPLMVGRQVKAQRYILCFRLFHSHDGGIFSDA